MTIIAQIRVPRTNNISTAARRLFFNQNCIGVKAKLKIRLSKNGKAIIIAISFFHAITNTFPKEIAIKTYKNVHTGPKIHEGGAQVGLINCEYQLYVFIIL